jgi:hypothetical protein
VSPCVAPEKDSKQPEWEVDCVTNALDENTLNPLPENDLWKTNSLKRAEKLSKLGALLT